MIIGIDHGYYAMKTPHICFPTGLSRYDYEPYTMQNVLQYAGNYYVCGTGRQTLMKDKTANDNYYLLLHVKAPIVIVECGFLSNSKEAARLEEEDYQDRMAWTIHMGIMEYLNTVKQKR